MQAIIQTGSEKVKYHLSDEAVINATNEQIEVRNPNNENENFDIGDLNVATCEIIPNFIIVPVDFKPDVYKYKKSTEIFTLNIDHPKYDEILAAQAL